MDQMKPPNTLNLEGNLAENWRRWLQQFNLFLIASGISEKSTTVQASTLLHVIGENALEIYNTFTWAAEGDATKVDKVIEKFAEYCTPRKNVTYERHLFNTRNQRTGEMIDQYATDLRTKAKSCEFGTLCDSLIRDRIVCGIIDDKLRARLLRESDLTLKKTMDICRANEVSLDQVKSLTNANGNAAVGDTSEINALRQDDDRYRKRYPNRRQYQTDAFNKDSKFPPSACTRCGGKHGKQQQCPAMGATCHKCEKPNHYSKMCKTRETKEKNVHSHEVEVSTRNRSDSESDDSFFIGAIHDQVQDEDKEWTTSLKINSKDVKFKIDTGAECNVISKKTYEKLSKTRLEKSRVKLGAFGGQKLKTMGKFTTICTHREKYEPIEFQVVNQEVPDILGLTTCLQLNLVKRVLTIDKSECIESTETESKDIFEQYKDVFTGLGCVKGVVHHIETDPAVRPVIHPPRRVSVPLRKKVKDELDRMERLDVIERVQEPSEWVNSLVTVVKPNGKIRLCIDPKDLNHAIKREHYPMKTIEEVISQMPNAKFFTKLDATQGYWQVRLDEESAKKCTFNSPYGRYRFNRLPFGISSAPEVFQSIMSQIFDGHEGVEVIVDDLLIWGETQEQHDERLKQTLDRAREAGVKLNKDKCEIGVQQVTYIGHTLSSSGLKPDVNKVEAIKTMDQPTDKAAVQRFLGMATYLAKFIPNFSQLAAPLRVLLEKNTAWHWDMPQQTSFAKLKQVITNAPILKYYDVNKDVTIQVDASPNGLGAVLLQDERPVAYASRSLSQAQQNYAQIEKEMLAITFGCERFHDYIFGKKLVTVHSDHKPLEFILKKPLYQAPQRLQRMILRTQKYSINVQYKPGKEVVIADTLSRACQQSKADTNDSSNTFEVNMLDMLPMSPAKVQQLQSATQDDKDLKELNKSIKEGWPMDKSKVPHGAKPYWNCRDQIVEQEGLLFKGNKVIVPHILRSEMLKTIHNAHLGIEKCKSRARDVLFWPGMNAEIEDLVKKCQVCQDHQPRNMKEPLHPIEIPSRPWEIVATDIFELDGCSYLVLVDAYSGFFEVSLLNGTKSYSVITHCKSQFARHGIPDKLVSDNGPQFASQEFSNFAQQYGFHHTTSSPHFPQSNGLAERYVQTAKNLLKKAKQAGTDPYLALLSYRNTPVNETLGSPNQRLFGRRTKTTLPTSSTLLQPCVINPKAVQEALCKKKEKQKQYFDQHTKELSDLKPGDNVRYETKNGLKPAVVTERRKEPRSYMIRTSNGVVLRRNRKHLYGSTGWNQSMDYELDDNNVPEYQPPQQRPVVVEIQQNNPGPVQAPHVYRTLSGRASCQPERYEAK